MEKAHPDVFNILLQVLDDGRLTDSQGRTVDFTNTVIVMTSNLGSEAITGRGAALGFGAGDAEADEEARRERVLRPLREHFRPEFLNRIDEIVVFRQLTDEQLRQITDLLLDETRRRLHAQDVAVEFTARGRRLARPSAATSPSTAPGRCAAPSSARSTTSSPGCCSTAGSPDGRPGDGGRRRTGGSPSVRPRRPPAPEL